MAAKKKVSKGSMMMGDSLNMGTEGEQQAGRGFTVMDANELMRLTGRTKQGENLDVNVQRSWLSVDPVTALEIYQRTPPVFGVISGRANRISALDWSIKPMRKEEDRISQQLRDYASVFKEYDGPDYMSLGVRVKMFQLLRRDLPELKPDLSNFNQCLFRWGRKVRQVSTDRAAEIKDFFSQPNPETQWPDFVKQLVADLHIHGRFAIYKQSIGNRVGSLFPLPGGNVFPIAGKFVGEQFGYIQVPNGQRWGANMPQVFFSDEVSFGRYMPNSSILTGMTPIDALINQVTEHLLFDRLMAEQADGTKVPEKLLVFGLPPLGLDPSAIGPGGASDPVDADEQRRIEFKLNSAKRRAGVATLTGMGTPLVMDLTRENTMQMQMGRQDQIKRSVGLVFNATNVELNETSSSGTSGRSTAEAQERVENQRGTRPVLRILEETFTRTIIPFRYGYGWMMEFSSPMSAKEQIEIARDKVASGIFSVNEVRVSDYNEEPVNRDEFDTPILPSGAPVPDTDGLLDTIASRI